MAATITVCALCYGDYPGLARRCLSSLVPGAWSGHVADVRVALNAVAETTRRYVVGDFARAMAGRVPIVLYETAVPVFKYPLMRRLLYDGQRPPAPLTMWFDDDSYVLPHVPEDAWWQHVVTTMAEADLIGSLYSLKPPGFRPGQVTAIKRQPWYTGKELPPGYLPHFLTGGWWVARTELLTRWNYPFPELRHNGGDSILGELARQQDYRLVPFNEGVAINADERGRESGAPRRGPTTPWIWEDQPGPPPDLSHHDFDCAVRAIGSATGPVARQRENDDPREKSL